jgi:hypothetical protein
LTSVSKGCLEERHQDTEVATVGPFYLPIVTPGVGPISMPISNRTAAVLLVSIQPPT